MRPARSGGGFSGFRIPSVRSVGAKLAIALVVGSVLFALLGEAGRYLVLIPNDVLSQLFLWQPLSYAFIANDPFGVIFGAMILWSIGGSMEQTWGSRRLLTFSVGTTVLAGILTVLLALVIGPLRASWFAGGWVMGSALWVAYGLSIGRGQANFWGIPMTGNMLAAVGAGLVLLQAAFARSIYPVLPELLAMGMAWAYVRGFSPRLVWLRFQSWRLQAQLKGRSKHLKVISQDRNMPSDSDRFLH